jgi:hypothetical protein
MTGLWLPIILVCSAPYVESCNIITGLELTRSKESCFKESTAKAKHILKNSIVYQAKPACQIIPTTILEEKLDL